MNVNSYIFQSPYSSQVQIGRLDSSASSDESTSNKNNEVENNSKPMKEESQIIENMQTQKTEEIVSARNSDALLDFYA